MVENTCVAVIDVWSYIGIASFLTVSLIGVLYLLGRMLSKSELEGIARKELSQFFITFILVIAVSGLASIVCQVTPLIVQDNLGKGDQFSASYNYLTSLIYKIGFPTVQRLWFSTFMLDSLSSVEYKTKIGGETKYGLKFKPGAVLKPFSKAIAVFNNLFNILIGSLQAQLVFIQLSEAFALTLILPIGMIVRSIPGLRKGGSYLIALAFGLYVVFPLTYVMDYIIFKSLYPDFSSIINSQLNPLESFKLSSDMLLIFRYFDEFSIIIPQATFLPLLNVTILISFVSIFAKFLSDFE